jgi:hypothetical protein
MAFPRAQLPSGLNDPSIEACTMGTLRKSSPNMRLNGTKTPWSKPGPSKPRPSRPRVSSFAVKRARIPAYEEKKIVRIFPREEIVIAQPQMYVLKQLNHTSGERRIATRTKLDFVGFWIEVVVIHEQRVFVPIVGHFFTIRGGSDV